MRCSWNSGTVISCANEPGLAALDALPQRAGRRARGRAELDRPHQAEPAHLADDLVALDQRARQLEQQRAHALARARPGPRASSTRSVASAGRRREVVAAERRAVAHGALHAVEDRVEAVRETSTAPIGTRPPDSALARQTMSGSSPQCSSARKRPVRPMPVCTSSHTNSVAARRGTARCARRQVAGRRQVDALALDRLDDQRGHVAARELALERVLVAERDRIAARQQRAEAVAELVVAVDRQRAEREAVEGVLGVQHARRGRSRRARS